MITMRQYLTFVTFLAVCIAGFTPLYRWWRKTQDVAGAEEREARSRKIEHSRREDARSNEVRDEQNFLWSTIRELRRMADIVVAADTGNQPVGSESTVVNSSVAKAPDQVAAHDPTEMLLDEVLGPASAPSGDDPETDEEVVRGPIFRRESIPEPDDLKRKAFEIIETRSKTRLVAHRGHFENQDAWAFIIDLPQFENMTAWPRPRAFGEPGYDWTKRVPFTEIPVNDIARALDELEAWFVRLAKGEERPTGGRLTKSCATWEDYEESRETQGYRVLWLEPRDE